LVHWQSGGLSNPGRSSRSVISSQYNMFAHQPVDLEANRKTACGLRGIANEQVRLDFIRKVYAIVTAQVITTFLVCALFVYGPLGRHALRLAFQNPNLVWWALFLPTFVVLIALSFNKKNYPVNFYLLGAFTLLISFSVGMTCAGVAAVGLGVLIVQAAAITALILGGLTLYAFNSKRNFSFLVAFLFPTLSAMVIWSLISFFVPSLRTGVLALVYSFLGAAVFCGYIVLDTFRIIHVLSVDDYIEGAIQLYLDIINLFLYILQILIEMTKKNN